MSLDAPESHEEQEAYTAERHGPTPPRQSERVFAWSVVIASSCSGRHPFHEDPAALVGGQKLPFELIVWVVVAAHRRQNFQRRTRRDLYGYIWHDGETLVWWWIPNIFDIAAGVCRDGRTVG